MPTSKGFEGLRGGQSYAKIRKQEGMRAGSGGDGTGVGSSRTGGESNARKRVCA